MKYLDRFFQPEGWEEKTFLSRDGKKIRYGHVEPAGPKKGTIVMTTGYADFIESFHETIHEYKNRGYAVWIMDWAGQGGSDKKRDHTGKAMQLEDHVRHLHEFRHTVVRAEDGLPTIMSTHSLGGQIGLNYLNMYPKDFDAAVMAAPLVNFGLSPLARNTLRAIFKSAVICGLRDHPIKNGRRHIQRQSHEEHRRLRPQNPVRMDLHRTFYLMNRELAAEDPTVGLVDSLLESTERLNKERVLSGIRVPVLFGVAGDDHLVDNDSIKRAAKLMPKASVVEFPGAAHGLWLERQNILDAWWKEIDSFLARVAPPVNDHGGPVNDNNVKDAIKRKPPKGP